MTKESVLIVEADPATKQEDVGNPERDPMENLAVATDRKKTKNSFRFPILPGLVATLDPPHQLREGRIAKN